MPTLSCPAPSAVHEQGLEAGDSAVAGWAAGRRGAVLLEAGVAVEEVQAGEHHAVALDLQARQAEAGGGRQEQMSEQEQGVWAQGASCSCEHSTAGAKTLGRWRSVSPSCGCARCLRRCLHDMALQGWHKCLVDAALQHSWLLRAGTQTHSCLYRLPPLMPKPTPHSLLCRSCTAAPLETPGTYPPPSAPAAATPHAPGLR